MKKYTSPAVTGYKNFVAYNIIAGPILPPKIFGKDDPDSRPISASAMAMMGSNDPLDILVSAVKSAAQKMFGEDFSSLRTNALLPCLEA